MNFLCITNEFKGVDFLRTIKEEGHNVYLVTAEKERHKAWPWDAIAETYYMPSDDGRLWDIQTLVQGCAHVYKTHGIDRIIALDDYDVSKAALLREEFRVDGMGQTTARHFFDKLAMRVRARNHGIPIPDFSHLFNDDDIKAFMQRCEAPWLVKPRMDAGALGIRKLYSEEDFWNWNAENYERRHKFLIENFRPGTVYHVDSISDDYKIKFTRASKYLQPPFEVAHGGGLFRSQTIDLNDLEHDELTALNLKVMKAYGMNFGASHSEFIRSDEGLVLLETSARVGGAHLADMVEKASGISLWKEWARLEVAKLTGTKYKIPTMSKDNAGIVVTLSSAEYPDYSRYEAPQICWHLTKAHHVGLILKDKSSDTIAKLLEEYTGRIQTDYATSVPLVE